MAVLAVLGQVLEGVVNLFACMVVLVAGCWVKTQVLMGGGSRVAWLILEATERPAA